MASMRFSISIKAIILGLLVQVVGSLLAGILLGIVYTILFVGLFVGQGMVPNQIISTAYTLPEDSTFLGINLFITFLFIYLGALTAAQTARTWKMAHAGIIGAIALAFNIFSVGTLAFWFEAALLVFTLPIALLAGAIAKG